MAYENDDASSKLRDAGSLIWECLKLTDGIRGGEDMPEAVSISVKEHPAYASSKNMELYRFLNEVYTVKALENKRIREEVPALDQETYRVTDSDFRNWAKRYSELLFLKYFYYCEINESVRRINAFPAEERNKILDEKSPFSDLLEALYNYRLDWQSLEQLFRFPENGLYAELMEINGTNREPLQNVVKRIRENLNEHPRGKAFRIGLLRLYIEFFYLLRQPGTSIEGEAVWLTFILSITSCVIHYHGVEIFEYRSFLAQCIRDTTNALEGLITPQICAIQVRLLYNSNTLTTYPSYYDVQKKKINLNEHTDEFITEIHALVSAVSQCPKLKYWYKQFPFGKGGGCIGIMWVLTERYITLSGYPHKWLNDLLSANLPALYKIISDSAEMRYYINTKNYITNAEYRIWVKKSSQKENNRMFSCCERRLLTVLYNETYRCPFVRLFVRFEPCELCLRALRASEIPQVLVLYVQDYTINRRLLKEMDDTAEEAYYGRWFTLA